MTQRVSRASEYLAYSLSFGLSTSRFGKYLPFGEDGRTDARGSRRDVQTDAAADRRQTTDGRTEGHETAAGQSKLLA